MNIPLRFWNTLTTLAVLLIALAAVLVIKELKSTEYIGSGIQATNTISVSGTGNAYAIPDVATFSFTVTENASTVTDAQSQATTKANAALTAVRNAGVADSDIQTTSYTINPHYDYQSGACTESVPGYCVPSKQVLSGYDVSETIQVKVRDLTKAGAIFASIGSLDVENVNGLDFSVDNPDTVQAQARTAAIADAQSKAQELAKELGVSLVRIVSFSENSGNSPQPIMYALAAVPSAAAAPTPEVPAGQQEVTDNVSITYEIN